MINKSILIFFLQCFLVVSVFAETICPVIPKPVYSEKAVDHFLLNKRTAILVENDQLDPLSYYLQNEILNATKIPLPTHGENNKENTIVLKYNERLKDDAYELKIKSDQITIESATNEGVFYGIRSLLQLIDFSENQLNFRVLPCWFIKDKPAFEWRGIMFDESRHFFGKEKVKQLLDWMAYYKLNRFHWHLTDQPGWRIEINKYPKLGLIGGIGSQTEPYRKTEFYSQDDIKEIVAYAAERFITIIPEIDMPGHAGAANRAYPEYSGGGSAKHPDFTFNPGKEGTYQFLSDVLREVDVLFPSQMIHLGGDEVHYGNEMWRTDKDVKQLMDREKLSSLKEVEYYFMHRMADSVFRLNNKLLAWDEIADMTLPTSKTIVFWWRQDKPEQLIKALDKGFNVVLCPRLPFYFDYLQDTSHVHGPKWNGEVNTVKDIYLFSTDSLQIVGQDKQILGMQANLWTESIKSNARLEFMLFPRIAALAEASWILPQQRQENQYLNFEKRLKEHLKLYSASNIYYYDPFNSDFNREPIK